ncbi:MAG: tryptophan synthase subunit alpha [Cyclobacteriaceae bacterium]
MLVGFGISNAATFQSACRYGAGAIVGSAFVSMLRNSTNLESDIITFVKAIRSVS